MLIPACHIHYADTGHGTVVLDVRHGQWLMLDADATRVWHALTRHGSTAGLAQEIAAPTGQDPRTVERGIAAFVDGLLERGVLVDADTDRPAQQRRKRWWR
ncbi:PqqD family protein [Streptomyces sp. I05A-00742]|uniref:PqqD family protein n=1 Tax=Streptomyces sp. I05A-00742 TaxID=2732853 RepID=UPI001489F61F|nr:PqqD family protein [Streptomyces sp. I05A-00742]